MILICAPGAGVIGNLMSFIHEPSMHLFSVKEPAVYPVILHSESRIISHTYTAAVPEMQSVIRGGQPD